MLLNYDFHENIFNGETQSCNDSDRVSHNNIDSEEDGADFRLIRQKIEVPIMKSNFNRQRLKLLLDKFSKQIGATMITGRAGTGKTTLATEFSKDFDLVSWYRVDSTDSDWNTFSRYFSSSLFLNFSEPENIDFSKFYNTNNDEHILKFVENALIEIEKQCSDKKLLIVFDDLHNVFDVDWFETFFKGLLAFNFPNISFLFLTRSHPPFPIWRLRSKQKLAFLDEKLLSLTLSELEEVLNNKGFDKDMTKQIYKKSYGRVHKALDLAGLLKNFA